MTTVHEANALVRAEPGPPAPAESRPPAPVEPGPSASVTPHPPVPLDLDVVDRLLGAPPDLPDWRVAELADRGRILATWLSTMEARGVRLGERAHAYLERVRRRTADLHALGAELSTTHGLRVLKGERIARYLPAPLLRQSGDVDLVAAGEAPLWECVRDLRARFDAAIQGVSVLNHGDGPLQVMVAVKWPASEPFLDKPMGVDVTTFAFGGDFRRVPVRVDPPDDEDLANLLAVAEERFQRRFRAKDRLDLLTLAAVLERRLGDDVVEAVHEAAAAYALAPELRRLIGGTHEWVPLSARWQRIFDVLGPVARQEKAQRRPGRPGVHRLRFGYPLDVDAGEEGGVRVHPRPAGDIASTPVGPCLLTDRLTVDDEELATAVELLGRW